jgi:hypothetical protein
VTHEPYIGRCLDRQTGTTTVFDHAGAGLSWLSAGGEWAVYTRVDETSTVYAWNAVTEQRRAVEAHTWIAGAPVTDGTWVAWINGDFQVELCSLDTTEPATVSRLGSYASSPAIDDGLLCWSALDETMANTVLTAYDCATGATKTARIEGFSAVSLDVSGRLIVAAGETPDYHSHLYVWDTRTGEVTRRLSTYPDYISRGFISGTRAVLDWVPPHGYRQVRVLDLATDELTQVTPDTYYAVPWSFDGSVIGLALKHPSETSTLEVAWCDLDERSQTDTTDTEGENDDHGDTRQESYRAAVDDSPRERPGTDETMPSVESTGAQSRPETMTAATMPQLPTNVDSESDGPNSAGTMPRTVAVIGALGALTLIGTVGAMRQRRASRTS